MTRRYIKEIPGQTPTRLPVSQEAQEEFLRISTKPEKGDRPKLALLFVVARLRAKEITDEEGVAAVAELRVGLSDAPADIINLIKATTNATPTPETAQKLREQLQALLAGLSEKAA